MRHVFNQLERRPKKSVVTLRPLDGRPPDEVYYDLPAPARQFRLTPLSPIYFFPAELPGSSG